MHRVKGFEPSQGCPACSVEGSGCRARGFGSRAYLIGRNPQQRLGFRVQGSRLRVQGVPYSEKPTTAFGV